jgi:TPR repeat protein
MNHALRFLRRLALLLMPLNVAGCAAPFIVGGVVVPQAAVSPMMETGQEVYDSKSRVELKKTALTGDHAAETKLAESYCCHTGGPLDRVSVYDNEEATQWYCRAAHAGYVPAQMRLAEIYYGRPLHGFRSIEYFSAIFGDMPVDIPVALMWAKLAAQGDDGKADDSKALRLRDRIDRRASDEQRLRADGLLAEWKTAPCIWSEVVPQAKFK